MDFENYVQILQIFMTVPIWQRQVLVCDCPIMHVADDWCCQERSHLQHGT